MLDVRPHNLDRVVTEEHLDAILTFLQNKRLHSELTDESFDVDSMKRLELNQ